jgi:hypothetical protein
MAVEADFSKSTAIRTTADFRDLFRFVDARLFNKVPNCRLFSARSAARLPSRSSTSLFVLLMIDSGMIVIM